LPSYSFDYRQSCQIGKLSFSISNLETKQALVETIRGKMGLCVMMSTETQFLNRRFLTFVIIAV